MQTRQVRWFEGMLVLPHHFQASEANLHDWLTTSLDWVAPYCYGVRHIEILPDALANFEVRIPRLQARLKDGTLISAPSNGHLDTLDVKAALQQHSEVYVYVVLPQFVVGKSNSGRKNGVPIQQRFLIETEEWEERNSGHASRAIETHYLNIQLRVQPELESPAGFESLPLFRLRRSGQPGGIPEIDPGYIPPLLACTGSDNLQQDILLAICAQLGSYIKTQASDLRTQGGWSESNLPQVHHAIMQLAAVNASYPVLLQLVQAHSVHPFEMYRELCRLIGQLSIQREDWQPPELPAYDHDDLGRIFTNIKAEIDAMFCADGPIARIHRVPLIGVEDRMEASLDPNWLKDDSQLFIGIRSGLVADDLNQMIGESHLDWKLGTSRLISQIYQNGEAGLSLTRVQGRHASLPQLTGVTYFKIETGGPYWQQLLDAPTLALKVNNRFVRGDFTGGDFSLAKSAMVYWIDELLVNSDWTYASQWRDNPLEREIYGSRNRAWKFFENADYARSLESTDALEVFGQCVALGFQGIYRSESLRRAVFQDTAQRNADDPPEEAEINAQSESADSAIKPVLKILLLPFTFIAKGAEAVFSGSLPRWAYIALEVVTVAVVTIVLAAINWYFDLERYLVGPTPLRRVWLGLVALLGYLCVRLMLLVIQLVPRRSQEFPDIAAAVASGLEALNLERINIRETPIFLIVGTNDDSDSAIASSPAIGKTFFGVREDASVRWYGNHEGVWITVPGVSAISAQVAHMAEYSAPSDQTPAGLRLTVEEKEVCARRMRYFVKLLRQIRGPVVPFNGVLLTVPYQWIDDPDCAQLADTVQADMEVLQHDAHIKCQCQVVFHEIEQTPEFSAYLERVADEDRQHRWGCSLPYFTAPTKGDVEPLHQWLQSHFEHRVFRLFQDRLDFEQNGMLYRLLESSRQSEKRFCSLLTNAFAVDTRDRFYLSGVYFASLTRSDRALFDEIPVKMLEDHDEVIGWNDTALRRNRRFRTMSAVAAALVVTMLALDVVALGGMLMGR
ncbi:Type VI secretion system baseplate component TssK1 [Durusdinium trenchii]|uniref:Type VI secretion system baseplate component TssK1 n=1 Tax=Durusdinium trenchii TaxID=1381693 RepID=A0ABP0PZV0_9DINO